MSWKTIVSFILLALFLLIFSIMYASDGKSLLDKISGVGLSVIDGGPNSESGMAELRAYVGNVATAIDKVHNSPDTGCFFKLPDAPSNFEGLNVLITKDSEAKTPSTLFGLQTGDVVSWFGRVNDVEPCAIVNYDAQYAFHNRWTFDMDPPQPEQSSGKDYEIQDAILIGEDNKLSVVLSHDFDNFFPYIYKPDAGHVCFIPMEKIGFSVWGIGATACNNPFIIAQSGKISYGIDTDCEDKLLLVAEQNICGV